MTGQTRTRPARPLRSAVRFPACPLSAGPLQSYGGGPGVGSLAPPVRGCWAARLQGPPWGEQLTLRAASFPDRGEESQGQLTLRGADMKL